MLILMYMAIVLYALFLPNNRRVILSYYRKNVHQCKSCFWIFSSAMLSYLSLTSKTYADVENYTVVFNLVNTAGMSYASLPDITPIWYVLCRFFGVLGLNYRGMIVGTIFLSTGIMHKALNSMEINMRENVFWGFFMLFPAVVQVVQMKFFLGTSIVFYSYHYLIESTKKGNVKFIIGVLVASLVHPSCLIFLVLVAVNYIRRSNIKKTIVLTTFATGIAGLTLKAIPKIASIFISSVRVNRYFYSTTSKMTFVAAMKVVLVWLIIVIFTGVSVYKNWKKYAYTESSGDLRSYRIALKYYMGLCLLGTTLLLMYYDANFFRFVEVGYLFGYVSISVFWAKSSSMTITKFLIAVISIFVSAIAITTYAPAESVLKPLFSYEGLVSIMRK